MKEDNLFKLVGTLVIISILSAIVLTFTYELSNPLIQKNKDTKLKNALKEVMPEAEKFEEVKNLPSGVKGEREGIKRVFKGYDKEGKVRGIVILSDAVGFNDFIHLLFGLDVKGRITQVKILEHLETPGLGERITKSDFLNQFRGKSPSLEGVDTITGATISSSAVVNRIKKDSLIIANLMKTKKI